MNVTLKFKEEDGQCYRMTERTTVKKAREYYKKHLKDDDNVIKVWLVWFDGWHDRCHSILKGM